MAQTVQLAVGTSTAQSADITVAAGAEAVIGIYAGPGTQLDGQALAYVYQKTPGAANLVAELNSSNPSTIVRGANIVYVTRMKAGTAFGVFSE